MLRGMRRVQIALVVVAALILAAVFTLIRPKVHRSHDHAAVQRAAAGDALDSIVLSPIEHTRRGVELATPLDASVELWSRRAEARAIEPARESPKTFSTRRLGGSGKPMSVDADLEIREHAMSWCEIVGIEERRRHDVGEVVVRMQQKWRGLCHEARSAGAVSAQDLFALRELRRTELGEAVGFALGDALIAGIRAKQGF